MNIHIRIVGFLWSIVGIIMLGSGLWGIATQNHYKSVVISWLLLLFFSGFAIYGGIMFVQKKKYGFIFVRITSILSLLYALAWLLLGGTEDAGNYAPAIIFFTILSIYSLTISKQKLCVV